MGTLENISEILQETREDGSYRELQDILNPHRHDSYPSDHIGDYSRYPIEYRWEENGNGWIDAARLKRAVCQVEPRAKKIPLADFKGLAKYPLKSRCDSAYRNEWRDQKQLKDISRIKKENPAAVKSNEIIAKRILPYVLERITENQEFWLLDLGIGELGTARGVIEGVPYGKRGLLHVIGIDIMKDARIKSEEMLTSTNREYGGLNPKNIRMIDCMFGQIHNNQEIKEYSERFNGIVSFAALHHVDDVVPVFNTAYELLSPGGALEIGDWLHWLWIAEVVKVGKNGNVPELYKEGVKQMAKVWVGLHGYEEEQKSKLEQDFDSSIYTAKGFNFHKWMHYNLDGMEPESGKETAYQSAEGHRAPHVYAGAIDRIFRNVEHYPIKDIIDEDIPEAVLLHGFSARKLK